MALTCASSTLARTRTAAGVSSAAEAAACSACSRATVTWSGRPTTACSSASSLRTARRSARERRQATADEVDEHLEILDARHALCQQIALDALEGGGERSVLIDDMIQSAAETALVLSERARHCRLDAGRQDGGELARRAPQLVDVALRARQQRAQIGACGLVGRKAPLAQLADAAQSRLARVPQWILLRVFGVHCAPLVTGQA